jgi:hypothetical protein
VRKAQESLGPGPGAKPIEIPEKPELLPAPPGEPKTTSTSGTSTKLQLGKTDLQVRFVSAEGQVEVHDSGAGSGKGEDRSLKMETLRPSRGGP